MAIISPKDFMSDWSKSPVSTTIQDLQKNANELRELKRQRAIQTAISKSVDASGNFNPEIARKTLSDMGFGESGDPTVNQISQARAQASDTRQASMVKDATMVQMGLMSPEQYNKKWYNTESVETVSEKPIDTSWMQGIPETVPETVSKSVPTKSGAASQLERFKKPMENGSVIVVEGKYTAPDSTYKLPDIPTIDRKIVKTPSQMSPEYLSESGDIGKSLFGKTPEMVSGNVSESNTKFASGLTKEDEAAYKTYLARTGIDVSSGNLQEQVLQRLRNVAETIAKPILTIDPKDPVKSLNDYQIALNEYPARVSKAQQEEIERLRNIPGSIQGEQIAKRGDIRAAESEQRAKESQTYELAGQKGDIYFRPVSKDEATRVKTILNEVPDIKKATKSFEEAYNAALSMAKIDGSVNSDNVVNNLVAMGAIPSSTAAKIKASLDPTTPLTRDAILWMKSVAFSEGTPASEKWVSRTTQKLNEMLKVYGGNPVNMSEEKTESGAMKQVKEKSKPSTKPKPKSETVAEKRKRLMGK